MEAETFEDVWDALARDPAEAANLKARSDLMTAIQARVRSWGVTQEAAAARLGIGRTRLNDLLRDKMHKFSLDALVNLGCAGLALEIGSPTPRERRGGGPWPGRYRSSGGLTCRKAASSARS